MVKSTLIFKTGGRGDDLMVYWAALAGVLAGVIAPQRLYFENPNTRVLLANINSHFTGIELLDAEPKKNALTYVRPDSRSPRVGFRQLIKILRHRFKGHRDRNPYLRKYLSEYGGNFKIHWSLKLCLQLGLIYSWKEPYDDIYDGWEEICVGLGISYKEAKEKQSALSCAWKTIQEKIAPLSSSNRKNLPLMFPSGGSFQDFPDSFIAGIHKMDPSIKIVRYAHENQAADIYFQSYAEAKNLISEADYVITNDSFASHLAQFFSRKHVLICTRSRPGNVCFPDAVRTHIVDLGKELDCRPCVYIPLTRANKCAAGFVRCEPLLETNNQANEKIRSALIWAQDTSDRIKPLENNVT